jgi:hypothetical protein
MADDVDAALQAVHEVGWERTLAVESSEEEEEEEEEEGEGEEEGDDKEGEGMEQRLDVQMDEKKEGKMDAAVAVERHAKEPHSSGEGQNVQASGHPQVAVRARAPLLRAPHFYVDRRSEAEPGDDGGRVLQGKGIGDLDLQVRTTTRLSSQLMCDM